MKRFTLPLLLILGLSGCETLSDKAASIEDRNDDSAESGSSTSITSRSRVGWTSDARGADVKTAGVGKSGTTPVQPPIDSVASTSGATSSRADIETAGLGGAAISVLEAEPLETSRGAGIKGMDSRKSSAPPFLEDSADTGMKGIEPKKDSVAPLSQASADTGMSRGVDPRKDATNLLSKRSIYFDFDSFTVKDEYRPVIEAHAAYLVAHRNARVTLQGNTDSRGSREYNLALGQKRAEAVRRALMVLGVQDVQTEAVSFGEEKPRALGETEEDYAENRRTDIVYGDE